MSTVTDATSRGAATQAAGAAMTADAAKNQLSKDTFLKLLVAQIKNQNPLNPADGVEFVTQLAQFTELEQTMSIRSELEALHRELVPPSSEKPDNESPHATA